MQRQEKKEALTRKNAVKKVPPKERHDKLKTGHLWFLEGTDPFQVFEVNRNNCFILEVTVLCGENITKGSKLRDFLDVPDPYVVLRVPGSPNGLKRTRHVDNCLQPNWNETFTFIINLEKDIYLEVTLVDANKTLADSVIGRQTVHLTQAGQEKETSVSFTKGSQVYIKTRLTKDDSLDLRHSIELCEEEKMFLEQRRLHVYKAMQNLLGDKGPRKLNEVPVVAVLGSGGGFRAMTAYCGVFKALAETGVLDCVFYVAGLSGASWYLSTLYSHPAFPEKGPGELQEDLRQKVSQTWKKRNLNFSGFISRIRQKSLLGQPVSFTDLFGHVLSEILLPGRKDSKLSEQKKVVEGGKAPLPLYTCLHVKKNVSARVYQEWIEFSPFEIGFAKYGVFMKPEQFGAKFYMGHLIRNFEELPLHFLQGVWGSAFTILFKRLVNERPGKRPAEATLSSEEPQADGRCSEEPHSEEPHSEEPHSRIIQFTDSELEDYVQMKWEEKNGEDMNTRQDNIKVFDNNNTGTSEEEEETGSSSDNEQEAKVSDKVSVVVTGSKQCSVRGNLSGLNEVNEVNQKEVTKRTSNVSEYLQEYFSSDEENRKCFMDNMRKNLKKGGKQEGKGATGVGRKTEDGTRSNFWKERRKIRVSSKNRSQKTFWEGMIHRAFKSTILDGRAGRAGLIYNPLRGLSLKNVSPINQVQNTETKPQDDADFKGHKEPMRTDMKKIYLVDSGLNYNLPFPLLLRPQRGVNLYLTFDFSGRHSDHYMPFKELMQAEEWAKVNNIPFPPIKEEAKEFIKRPNQECYVFRDRNDPHCPVVVHFIIINRRFRIFKAPGVPRQTAEELEFANFDIFSDPQNPYNLYSFTYNNLQFDRLVKLLEFNTLDNLEVIKDEMAEAIRLKTQRAVARWPIMTGANLEKLRRKYQSKDQESKSDGKEDL